MGRTCPHAKGPSTLGVNEEQSGNRENDLDSSVTQRSVQSLVRGVTGLGKDGRTVERDNVDSAHLLGNHNSGSSVVGTPDSGHTEAVPHAVEVASSTCNSELGLVNDIRVVVVASGDDGVGTEFIHGLKALGDLAMLHQPTRGFWAKEDADHEDERRNEG